MYIIIRNQKLISMGFECSAACKTGSKAVTVSQPSMQLFITDIADISTYTSMFLHPC